MNKIESARIIVKQKGNCIKVLCAECFNREMCTKLYEDGKDVESSHKLALAESYIKRHEGKSKKKDHIRDATKKGESTAIYYEPCVSCRNNHGLCSTKERTANVKNCVSYDPIIKKKIEEPKPVEEPTPLEIAKMIRDNGYSCRGLIKNCPPCPLWGKGDCGTSDKIVEENHIKRKQLIDNYISAKEPKPVKKVGVDNDDVTLARPTVKENLSVPCEHLINGDSCGNAFEPCDKDCPANSEYPDPIRVDIPDIFYCPTPQGILRFKRSQILLKDTNNDDCLLKYHEEYPCYRTIEEAVIVAKKLWGGK